MDSRRDFLKKAMLLAAGGGFVGVLPASIQRAFAIDPEPDSTYLDAEHIVILMQENRSFDHMYGMLRGVRGFNDPRAMNLPNGNPVWLQSNLAGDTYPPFRLNIKETKSTWMGSLPHSRESQQGASNHGKHNGWLEAKRSGEDEYRDMPLTMGYYNRDDLPFFYALADAFTVCDQNFCSSQTATEPNRLHLWTGTVRAEKSVDSFAYVRNEDMGYEDALQLKWTTFPERLETLDISWKIYQNEISLPTGFSGEEDAWLSNFDDNPIEYFTKFNVFFSAAHRNYLLAREKNLAAELDKLTATTPSSNAADKDIADKRAELEKTRADLKQWSEEAFARLSVHEQNLHRKAFVTNEGDPDYRSLSRLAYQDDDKSHDMAIPKGDVLYQFREDVKSGRLPTVSWIVPPEKFSDHPCSPWYGAWYLSETLDILTQTPEVWKKTIFILCYDENDGYFDHIPPFVPPRGDVATTGKVSSGIDASPEFVSQAQENEIRQKENETGGWLAGPIGLGFRVPLVIVSPWSRGGYVCSQVFDHTSILQFLEKFLSQKTGQPVTEPNITDWRRTVCGDLTSVFRPYHGEKIELPESVARDPFLGTISRAQFRPLPDDYKKLSSEEIESARQRDWAVAWLPRQEGGSRVACALPYELSADGSLSVDQKSLKITLGAGNKQFGAKASGAPFRIYASGKAHTADGAFENGRVWNYAVTAGGQLSDELALADFENGIYRLQLSGPNGFHREFCGSAQDPRLELKYNQLAATEGGAPRGQLRLVNGDSIRSMTLTIDHVAYGYAEQTLSLAPGETKELTMDLQRSSGWYHFRIRVQGFETYERQYAGHVETGKESLSDPAMG